MSLLNILNLGHVGANTAQQGVQIASQNLANVGTEGYSRKQQNVRPETGLTSGPNARRVIEPFVERRLIAAQSSNGEAQGELVSLQPLDTIFDDGDGSLGTAIDDFQASIQDLASRPSDMAVREQVLARAKNVAAAFNNAAAGLDQARADANDRIRGSVDEVNQRLNMIAEVNGQIGKAELTGVEAGDLRDKRDTLVRQIAERVPVTVVTDANTGAFSLTLGGSVNLITADNKVNPLGMGDGGADAKVTITQAGQKVDITTIISSGSIGGQLKARDGALKDLSTKLDRLAAQVSEQYNAAHAGGVGLDGQGGRDLFVTPPAGNPPVGAARGMAVSAAVSGNPQAIAAGTDATLASDNRAALAMSDLSSSRFALGNMTVTEALASLTSQAGMAIQLATNSEAFASGALEQVSAIRDNMSGVSSDEEMVSLMKYQQAYTASLQIIKVADDMMSELMNIARR